MIDNLMEDMESLIENAKSLFETCQIEEAYQQYSYLLQQYPDVSVFPPEFIDDFAELASMMNDMERAIQAYRTSIAQSPLSNPSKYFSLAQLSKGPDSLSLYMEGINVLENSMEDTARNQQAKAYAAVAELYMTDLCDELEAENQCESFIQKAIGTDENCLDAYLALANLRLVRNRKEEAQLAMDKAKSLLENTENLPNCQVLAEIARCLVEIEDYEGVLSVSDMGLNMDITQDELMYLHTFALSRLGKKQAALEMIKTLKERNLSDEIREATLEVEAHLMASKFISQ